jgi:hypothetical protein
MVTFSLHVKDYPSGVGKFRQALAVHAVIHERSALIHRQMSMNRRRLIEPALKPLL